MSRLNDNREIDDTYSDLDRELRRSWAEGEPYRSKYDAYPPRDHRLANVVEIGAILLVMLIALYFAGELLRSVLQ